MFINGLDTGREDDWDGIGGMWEGRGKYICRDRGTI